MRLGALTFDAANTEALSAFWAALLDRERRPARVLPNVWVLSANEDQPDWLFLPVPEPKVAKNRFHPDLHTAALKDDVARAVSLGATIERTHDEVGRWVVLRDPEGNEFCLVEDAESEPQ